MNHLKSLIVNSDKVGRPANEKGTLLSMVKRVGVRWRYEANDGGDVLGVDQAEGGAHVGDLDGTVAVGGERNGVGLGSLRHGLFWCLKTQTVNLMIHWNTDASLRYLLLS